MVFLKKSVLLFSDIYRRSKFQGSVFFSDDKTENLDTLEVFGLKSAILLHVYC